ncbi:hypothetical protein BDF22DRAFT_662967 [Syncephalis plumigaleata]|nr:hypothetical protein BDF22DRAFT_662967 [Syncephalis plumigaleata]
MTRRPRNRLAHRINTDTVTKPWKSLKQQGVKRSCIAGCRVLFRRDRPERALLAVAAVSLVGLIIVIAILLASSRSNLSAEQVDQTAKQQQMNNTMFCQSKACLEIAAELLPDMNTTVDPCVDFYAYACDGWIASNPLPESESRYTRFDIVKKKNREVIRTILEDDQTIPGLPTDSRDAMAADARNLDRLRTMYRLCSNDDQVNERRTVPIRDILAIAKTPFSGINENSTTPEVLAKGLAQLSVLGIGALVNWHSVPSKKDPTKYILQFHQSGISLSDSSAYRRPIVISSYKYQITRLLARILNDMPGEDVNDIEPWMRDAGRLVAEFEAALASRYISETVKNDPDKSYRSMTMGELADALPSIDMLVYVKTLRDQFIDNYIGESSRKKLLSTLPSITRDTVISVISLDYIQGLEKLLKETPPMALHWYLVWRVIVTYGDSLDTETSLLVRELNALVNGVHSKAEPRIFAPLIGRYFMALQSSEMELDTVRNMTNQLQEAFITRAREQDWLDNTTRDKVIEKARLLTFKIGAPSYPNTHSSIDLDAYYASFTMNSTHHFENVLAYNKFKSRHDYLNIGHNVHSGEWTMPASSANMYYSQHDNSIVIPAGILQPPFYGTKHPDYYSYGSLGMFLLMNYRQGRKFDGTGRFEDWWTQGTKNEFDKKSDCFKAQYAHYTVEGPDGARLRVNGDLTLTEIMAGKLNQAYRAWQTVRRNSTQATNDTGSLPGFLRPTTNEQLFFLSFGRSFCNVIRPENVLERINTDRHPPLKHRVNGALKNSRQFADAYQCTSDSPMNPEKKCELW